MLEKNSTIPIYIQLKNILKGSILTGEFGENEMIPSETQLADKYQITRTTVRRAIAELVNENLLRSEHGKGTFVCLNPVSYSMWNFSSFTDYVQKKGKTATSKILSAQVIEIDENEYFQLERARGIKDDGVTLYITVDTSLIPLALFPGITAYNFENRSLYEVFRREYSISPSYVDLLLKPILVDQHVADVFGIAPNTPLLMAKGEVYNEKNLLVERTQVIYSPHSDFKLATRIASM